MDKAKPFGISKREVWMAYKRVKENRGAAGVDDQTIAEFEKDLKNNLYRIWNRMSSGSYFPPPVRRVDIPKGEGYETAGNSNGFGSHRPDGSQAISGALVEPVFHKDSYGIVLVGRRMMRWLWPGSDAGAMTGCSTSTSRVSLTKSIGNS